MRKKKYKIHIFDRILDFWRVAKSDKRNYKDVLKEIWERIPLLLSDIKGDKQFKKKKIKYNTNWKKYLFILDQIEEKLNSCISDQKVKYQNFLKF